MHLSEDYNHLIQVPYICKNTEKSSEPISNSQVQAASTFCEAVLQLENTGLKETRLIKGSKLSALEAVEIFRYIQLNDRKICLEAEERGCSSLYVSKKESQLARSMQIFFNQIGKIQTVLVPVGNLMDTGHFKKVKVGFIFNPAKIDPELVAISNLRLDNNQLTELEAFIKEAHLSELFSATVSPLFHGVSIRSKEGSKKASLITQFYEKGTLKSCAGNLDKKTLFNYSRQLVILLKEVDDQGYIHRDIRLENVVRNEAGDLKLIDWGNSLHQDEMREEDNLFSHTSIITPEALSHCKANGKLNCPTSKEDMWALGILLYELNYGRPPRWVKLLNDLTSDCKQKPSVEQILLEIHEYHYAEEKKLDQMNPIDQLIWHLLDPDPETRWNQVQALEHLNVVEPEYVLFSDQTENLPYGRIQIKLDVNLDHSSKGLSQNTSSGYLYFSNLN